MEWIVFWVIMAGVVAVVAHAKGFDPVGWFWYGAFLWPVALAHVIAKRRAG